MRRRLSSILAMTAVIVVATGTCALAQDASSFQRSCSNIRYEEWNGVAMIAADCARRDGTVQPSSVAIDKIHNIEGHLVVIPESRDPSSFQRSCDDIRIVLGGEAGVQLQANCRTSEGNVLDASAPIWDIENIDGSLQYR